MNRENIANALLAPPDFVLGTALRAARKLGKFDAIAGAGYDVFRDGLRLQFEKMNSLRIEGAENVPATGGVVFASNHQSWMDVQVLTAASPRRITFMAKAEFERWPVLRHLIDLSQSVFIRRGGDPAGLQRVVEILREGKAVAIYPEGTIPGEEDIPRHAVDPMTGLLRGRTGAVRLALEAGVPIVPVGVSGTGRAFPPEVYPRLELLRLPTRDPVTIRFGRPIQLPTLSEPPTKEWLHDRTHALMLAISDLIDHRQNYVPVQVPIPPLPTYERLGVLLLHGFTSSVDTVDRLQEPLRALGVEVERPLLRGHGTHFRNMAGATAHDWYEDGEAALLRLAARVDKVIVVGLSMGGLVALDLGMRHADKIAGVVTLAAALRFVDPLADLSPVLAKVVPFWPSPNAYHDKECAKRNTNYPKFATASFASLLAYGKEIEGRLPELKVPIRVIGAKRDQVVKPVAANLVYERVSSPHREIVWFPRTGHEMLLDMEADAVAESVVEFVRAFRRA